MRWRRDTLTAAERRRLADRDIDVAKLTDALAERTRERDELVDLARGRNERAGRYAADAAEARGRADELAARVRVLEAQLAERDGAWSPSRPEQCRTLAECTSNRARAERAGRVVGDGDTAAAAERCITGSGCAPRAVA